MWRIQFQEANKYEYISSDIRLAFDTVTPDVAVADICAKFTHDTLLPSEVHV
jgi:hypothetical protein